jgi:aminopeptidase N
MRKRAASFLLALLSLCLPLVPAAGAQVPSRSEPPHLCAASKAAWLARSRQAVQTSLPSQEDYDVKHYDLDLYFTTTGYQKRITGTVTVRAEVVGDFLDAVDLDFAETKTVDSVSVAGSPSTFTQTSTHVTVDLDRTYAQGEEFEVAVHYHGVIIGGGLRAENRSSGLLIWSLSSVYRAREWWPCKDWPWDKADSVDVHINVPNTMTAVSNGVLTHVEDNGTRAIYHWHEKHPISTYLVSVACHPYTVFSDWYHYGPTDSMEVRHHVFPDHYPAVVESVQVTVSALELFAQLFGEYPFVDEKYGHSEVEWSGGMEHQTVCTIGAWAEYLIVHELAHQWWGDMITCETFQHIWLNEGFATYAEALWWEATQGTEAYHTDMSRKVYFGAGTVIVEDPDNDEIFDYDLSYCKGAWVLHMLRHVVGDSTFFDILRAYGSSDLRYGTATTEDFQGVCESVSGLDLDEFFHQWIYEEFYPIYECQWSWEGGGSSYEVSVAIDQLQTNYVFNMPMDVTVYTVAGESTFVVGDSLAHQGFTLTVNAQPTGLELDRDNWILHQMSEPLPAPSFDRGILLVNGVSFIWYGDEITSAYEDSVFWGDHSVTFWDVYDEGVPYPSTLPVPSGHGFVPADTLKQFSSVVWVSGGFGDSFRWHETAVFPYLEAGGNVLLLARESSEILNPILRDYLGLVEGEQGAISECVSVYAGLVDMPRTGAQTLCDVFDTTLTQVESELLFVDTMGFSQERGVGVWRKPVMGGTHRPDGAQFILIAGRPYRWSHDELRANVQYMLDVFFEEPYVPSSVAVSGGSARFALGPCRPSPFRRTTTTAFSLPGRARVALRIYDVGGRLVATLVDGIMEAGDHAVTWGGTDERGRPVGSGVYFYRLTSGEMQASRKVVRLR